MRKIIVSIFLVLTFLCSSAIAEIITVKHTVKQTFGGGQSPDDARISGMAKAKREALEKAGTYIESLTVVKNSKVEKDEILALTAGVLKAEVVSQKNYASDDAFGMEIVVNVVVDTSVLEERVKKLLQDKTHLMQLKETQKREKELLQKVAQLEEENRKLIAKNQSTQQLKKEFQQVSQGLTAGDWYSKALDLWRTDSSKAIAIEYLNEAIRLQPDYADAYSFRGYVYVFSLKQYQQAIEDYSEALRLKPNDWFPFLGRGIAYASLGQYQKAIKDYNESIRLQPDNANAYIGRGNAYFLQGNKKLGCRDAQKACELGNCKALDWAKGKEFCR